mmetsp:Transcript_4973/g.7714  ORF Transcript_4973/g.7714 Transcript_4973/m.7714 type:complete len:85 (+) Transcript_4973:123-377(+)
MDYLRGLESRFQCAGMCNTALRLWEDAGTPAAACSMFISQWLHGANVNARIILWYNLFVILISVPLFILLLDSFFESYYIPLMK